jgi:hypothetical protein
MRSHLRVVPPALAGAVFRYTAIRGRKIASIPEGLPADLPWALSILRGAAAARKERG